MPPRIKKIRHDEETRFYVYVVRSRRAVVYVGKGSGNRAQISAKKRGGDWEIVARANSDDEALELEREWIAKLRPTLNKCAGGNGSRAVALESIPREYEGRIANAEFQRSMKEFRSLERAIKKVGVQQYCAALLGAVEQVQRA